MRKVSSLVLVFAMFFSLVACGQKAPTWQEQYDLGVRYLSDGNYEEAIIAFTAAIEIDPKRPETYMDLAQLYIQTGDETAAEEILRKGYEATGNEEILSLLQTQEEKAKQREQDKALKEIEDALYPEVNKLAIPFTIDRIEIGATTIDVPKKDYRNYIGYYTNLMNDDTVDTVYNGFWDEKVANPLGHDENEFGFLFSAPSGGGPVTYGIANQRGLTCLGQLQIQDNAQTVLDFFHFDAEPIPGHINWELDDVRTLYYQCTDSDNFSFTYTENHGSTSISAHCEVREGVLYSVSVDLK